MSLTGLGAVAGGGCICTWRLEAWGYSEETPFQSFTCENVKLSLGPSEPGPRALGRVAGRGLFI